MVRPSLCLLAPVLLAARLPAQRPPLTPIIVRGACPFECCQLGAWTAVDTLPVYAGERSTGAQRFLLLPGRRFAADSADFFTLVLGLIRVRRPLRLSDYLADEDTVGAAPAKLAALRAPLAAGDTVYYVGDVTEVGARVWARGVDAVVEPFWAEPGFEDAAAPAFLTSPLVREWWVHITDGARSGWIQAWNRRIDGTDACA